MRAGAYISFPIATPAAAYRIAGAQNPAKTVRSFKIAREALRSNARYRRGVLVIPPLTAAACFLCCSTMLGTYGFRGGNVRLSVYPQPTFGKEPCGNPTAI